MSLVVEDTRATTRWRRRAVAAWAAAVTLVGGGVAGLGGLALRYPFDDHALLWSLVFLGALGAGVGLRVWQQATGRLDRPELTWRPADTTPHGRRGGWALRRPNAMGQKDRLLHAVVGLPAIVPFAAATVTGGEPRWLAFVCAAVLVPVTAEVTRRTARLLRSSERITLTGDGLLIGQRLIRWDDIEAVTLSRHKADVRLKVAGRRRPVRLDGGDYAMKAEDLVRWIEYYRDEPTQRRALG